MLCVRDFNGDGDMECLILQSSGAHANEAFDPRFPELDFYKTGAEDQDLFCMTLLNRAGSILWQTGQPWALERPFSWNGHWNEFCEAVDLDGDGALEIMLVHKDELRIYEGSTGQLKRRKTLPNSGFNYARAVRTDASGQYHIFTKSGTSSRTHSYGNPSLLLNADLDEVWRKEVPGAGHRGDFADVDGDGLDELFIGFSLFDHDGSPLWSHDPMSENDHLDDSAIADLDGDGHLEFALAHDGHDAMLHNDDGSVRARIEMEHCQNILAGRFLADEPGLQLLIVDRQTPSGTREVALVDADGHELSRHSTIGYYVPVAWPTDTGPTSFLRSERPPSPEGAHRMVWVDALGNELCRMGLRDSFHDHIVRHGLDKESYDRATYHGAGHSPATGDIDGDGEDELVVTDRESVWVFKKP